MRGKPSRSDQEHAEPAPSWGGHLPRHDGLTGIHNFSKGLANDSPRKGIRVNAVAPGPIWTPLIPATMPTERTEAME
jgi:hypothetical protein